MIKKILKRDKFQTKKGLFKKMSFGWTESSDYGKASSHGFSKLLDKL